MCREQVAICLVFIVFAKLVWKPCAQQISEGDDSECLKGLWRSLQSDALSSWNEGSLESPCSSSTVTNLAGITCNNNRVYAIALNASNLVGTIPWSLANCSFLESVDISNNRISGPIPSNIGNLTYLTVLNFSNNMISDIIPIELSQCLYLNVIDLHGNKLTGPIPGQLGMLQRLKVFDVSSNELSGAIPATLSNTSTGAPRFNSSFFSGNPNLYGYPLLPGGSSHSLSVLAIVAIGLASGLISLVVSFSSVCLWLRVTEQGLSAEEGKISQIVTES